MFKFQLFDTVSIKQRSALYTCTFMTLRISRKWIRFHCLKNENKKIQGLLRKRT